MEKSKVGIDEAIRICAERMDDLLTSSKNEMNMLLFGDKRRVETSKKLNWFERLLYKIFR